MYRSVLMRRELNVEDCSEASIHFVHGSQLSLCQKEPARSKQETRWVSLCSKASSRGVLNGIRLLAWQLLGTVLDIEVCSLYSL